MKRLGTLLFAFALAGGVASAHIMVSPMQAKVGVAQAYELRVHNEGSIATTAVDLQIPDAITVLEIPPPSAGTVTTNTRGDRITALTWTVDVPPNRYVALKFTARNPDNATEVRWNVRQHLADGSTVDWSDRPGAKEKASVTKIGSPSSAALDHDQADHGASHDADHDVDHAGHDHGDPGQR